MADPAHRQELKKDADGRLRRAAKSLRTDARQHGNRPVIFLDTPQRKFERGKFSSLSDTGCNPDEC